MSLLQNPTYSWQLAIVFSSNRNDTHALSICQNHIFYLGQNEICPGQKTLSGSKQHNEIIPFNFHEHNWIFWTRKIFLSWTKIFLTRTIFFVQKEYSFFPEQMERATVIKNLSIRTGKFAGQGIAGEQHWGHMNWTLKHRF